MRYYQICFSRFKYRSFGIIFLCIWAGSSLISTAGCISPPPQHTSTIRSYKACDFARLNLHRNFRALGESVKLEHIWNKKAKINSNSWRHTRVDNNKKKNTQKKKKPRPVASAAHYGGGGWNEGWYEYSPSTFPSFTPPPLLESRCTLWRLCS